MSKMQENKEEPSTSQLLPSSSESWKRFASDKGPVMLNISQIDQYFNNKPFISDVYYKIENNDYIFKCAVSRSSKGKIAYNVQIKLCNTSGCVLEGSCDCKINVARGKCRHAIAALFYLSQYVQKDLQNKISHTMEQTQFSQEQNKTEIVPQLVDKLANLDINNYKSACFPRCEYKTRFEGTSAFSMRNPEYYGSYFRSTALGGNSDRLSKLSSKKTYENPETNKSKTSCSKAGTFHSPWQFEEYKNIFYSDKQQKPKVPYCSNIDLYDSLLEYKKSICKIVIEKFHEHKIPNRKIEIYFQNDYPCIMVTIPDFNNIKNEKSSFYNIAIAYFTAIANDIAKSKLIPIEIVIRSSFGHNIPSVAETSTSFRINIGIVPKCYAELVLVQSLIKFNNYFVVQLNKFKLNLLRSDIEQHNNEVARYNTVQKNKKVDKWNSQDNLYSVLCNIGDAKGKKVSYQIMRKKEYVDLLADYVSQQLTEENPDFAKPLQQILTKLDYSADATLKAKIDTKTPYKFFDKENKQIKEETHFWEIIEKISTVFEAFGIDKLSNAIQTNKLFGLYSLLEEANLEFIRNSTYLRFETSDGYGSDSDCEIEYGGNTFYSKKIIVATGMRAINLAHLLSKHRTDSENIDTKYMYYETGDAIKKVVNLRQSLGLSREIQTKAVIRYIDLSHCVASGLNENVNLKAIYNDTSRDDVIVFDYTSTKTDRINKAVKLFITKVPIILLVNSGLKNEQIGADINPYGTVRIIAKDLNDLNELYYGLATSLDAGLEILPKELHCIRKAYKNIGAVVTNEKIYGPNYTAREGDTYYSDHKFSFRDKFRKIFDLFHRYRCETGINKLKTNHQCYIYDILSWDGDKIEFLSSEEVEYIIENEKEYGLAEFDTILSCYENDSELTKSIVNFYNFNEIGTDLFMDTDFGTVFYNARTIKEENNNSDYPEYVYDDDDEILESMARKNRQDCSYDYFNSSSEEEDYF